MTKTPQQIRNEVEKEIKEAEDKIHENAKDDKHYSAWVHSDMIKIISEGKVKLSILTEYDKAMKEMIEEFFKGRIEWAKQPNTKFNEALRFMYIQDEKELLSKIGDNSEVEK